MDKEKIKGLNLKTRLAIMFVFIAFMPPVLMSVIAFSWMRYRKMFEEGISVPIQDVRLLVMHAIIATLVVQLLIAAILIVWSYRGMVAPLIVLTEATRKIEEGNFDFELKARGQTREIDRLCIHFESMRKQLHLLDQERARNDEEQRKLISNIGHDLKTPVTAIKGYAEGIIDGVADTSEKKDKYVRTIYNKANDLDRLISELTYYSRIDNVNIPYEFMKINVSEYFDDCKEELSMELDGKGIAFDFKNELLDDTYVIADPVQMRKVINNIIGNSIKYNDKKSGHIGIVIKDAVDFIHIDISDNGKGISQKDLPNIFERFYRGDTARNSATGGSGIGLSIVHKIVDDHGGRIWATSQLGKGTTMHIELRKYKEG